MSDYCLASNCRIAYLFDQTSTGNDKLKLGTASKKTKTKPTAFEEQGTKNNSRSKFEMTWIFAELQKKLSWN